MTAAVRQHLRCVAAILRDGVMLDADDAKRLADAFDKIADGDAPDVALGLRLKPGRVARKNRSWRGMRCCGRSARRYFPGMSATEQARQLCTALARYHAGSWQRDRSASDNPHGDTLKGDLWQVLRHRDRVVSARHALSHPVDIDCQNLGC